MKHNYKAVFDGIHEAFIFFDADTAGILDANAAAENMFGYSKDELQHFGLEAVSIGSQGYSKERLLEKFKSVEAGKISKLEWLCRDNDDDRFSTDLILRRIADVDSSRDCILANVKYIAKEKERDNERFLLKMLMNTISDPMWLQSIDGTFLLCNVAYAKIHGLSVNEIVGKSYYELVGKELADSFLQRDQIALATDKPIVNEEWVIFKDDGHKALLETVKVPFCDIDGNVIGILSISRDITEREKMQAALQRSQEQLKNINTNLQKAVKQKIDELRKKDGIMLQQSRFAAMGEMLSMIAHQWRQPLNAVSTASINLKMFFDMGVLNEDTLQQQCTFIEDQTQRMSKTINDFMEFFRPDKEKQPFFVSEAVDEVEKIIESQLKNRNITLIKNMDMQAKVVGIKNELEHVILNILTNARDALDEKNPPNKQITLSVEQKEKMVTITIGDSAGGIPKEIINRIFDPYFTTKEKSKGVGIGLYMSKTIINRNFKGELKVFNGNDGAIFKIEIAKKGARE